MEFSLPSFLFLLPCPTFLAAQGSGASPYGTLFLVVSMVAIFYFLLIRPQRKFQKERQAMLQSLKKHDQVLTRGGIYGTIMEVRPEKQEIIVEIAKNTRVRMARSAVEAVIPRDTEQAKEEKKKNR